MWGSGILKGLGITLKHLFEWDITEQYPEERPKLYPRFRGRLMLNLEKCIACGMCVKSCPNGVLSFTEARLKDSKKKVITSYTIDHQYCMFCNLCVEACPTKGLYFSHDFEWAVFKREDIKTVYKPDLTGLELVVPEAENEEKTAGEETEDKLLKQVNAMITAIKKNPAKALSKVVESEDEALKLAEILGDDENKIKKLAELIVSDKEKAAKVAKAFLAKGKKEQEG